MTERPDQGGRPIKDRGKLMTRDIPPDPKDRAHALFGDLIEGREEEVHRELDASLRGQVRVEWFARARAKAMSSVGSFERMVALPARQSGGYAVVDVLLTFVAGDALGEVVFDRDGKVAGLALEYPYPRPRWPEPGERWGGGAIRNPQIAGLMRTLP
jgi:hypothetical protein